MLKILGLVMVTIVIMVVLVLGSGAPTIYTNAQQLPNVTSNISLIMTPDLPQGLGSQEQIRVITANGTPVKPDPKSITVTEEWKTYISEKHGLSIDYMTNATTIIEGQFTKFDPDQDLRIYYPLYSFGVFQQDIVFPDLKEMVDESIDYTTNEYRLYDEYWILISGPDLIKIDNETAYTYTLSLVDKETDRATMVQSITQTYHNNSQYQFMFTASVSNFDRSENIRNHMIESIKFY